VLPLPHKIGKKTNGEMLRSWARHCLVEGKRREPMKGGPRGAVNFITVKPTFGGRRRKKENGAGGGSPRTGFRTKGTPSLKAEKGEGKLERGKKVTKTLGRKERARRRVSRDSWVGRFPREKEEVKGRKSTKALEGGKTVPSHPDRTHLRAGASVRKV